MSQVVLNLPPPAAVIAARSSSPALLPIRIQTHFSKLSSNSNGGRFTCLFSGNNRNKQEQARKALESALGGKKKELENWDKEIKKREQRGGGGNGGGGGGWFRWFNGDHFWQEAQQASLAILIIILATLVLAKGDVMLAVVFNPLLHGLRGIRNTFTLITSRVLQKVAPTAYSTLRNTPTDDLYTRNTAKETVMKKWGSD